MADAGHLANVDGARFVGLTITSMIRRALVVSTRIPLRATLARVLQSLGYSVEARRQPEKRALELANQDRYTQRS